MGDWLWKALLGEFLGTFVLVFIAASAVALSVQQGGTLFGSALAYGLTFAAIMYAWGCYSGTHLNPAVSFGFAVAGRMHWGLMLGYWIVQLVAAIAAAALVAYFYGTDNGAGATIGSLTDTQPWVAVLFEAFLTFFLVLAFLFVTGNPAMATTGAVAIGMFIMTAYLAGAPLTGASMNPARSLGSAIFSMNMGSYWVYVVGPLIGALVGSLAYKLMDTNWSCKVKTDCDGNPIRDECGNKILECKRDMVDSCGKTVKDCGKDTQQTYTKPMRDTSHDFRQASYLERAAAELDARGMSPLHAVEKATELHEKHDSGSAAMNLIKARLSSLVDN